MNHSRLTPYLLLTPALLVVGVLFLGGLALAIMQSLGYMPILGRDTISFDAYRAIFTRTDFYRSLLLTLWISAVSTTVATCLALLFALALRKPFRGSRVATFFFQLNLPIPHIVGAVGILFLFSQSGFLARISRAIGLIQEPADFPALVFDPWGAGIILEYIWKTTFFIGTVLLAALLSQGEGYEDVARNLGAGRWQRFRYVTLPMLTPAIVSSSVLIFAFTFGAFDVPLLLGQRFPSALPVLAYRSYVNVDLNARPQAMAMSVVISAVITLLVLFYMRIARRKGA